MSSTTNQKFFVSQKGILIKNNKCLILEISDHPGFWDLPGGHIEEAETNKDAFQRELKEELGIDKFNVIAVVDYEVWYHGEKKYPVCGIANLIQTDDDINVSNEHLQMRWVSEAELDNYKFLWPDGKRMLQKSFEYHRLLNKL